MALLLFRTRTYARNIYLYGNATLLSIPAEYREPVMQFAATDPVVIGPQAVTDAYVRGWITQEEYYQTISYLLETNTP